MALEARYFDPLTWIRQRKVRVVEWQTPST